MNATGLIITQMGLGKLNSAEQAGFMSRTLGLITEAGAHTIGASDELIADLNTYTKKLIDVLSVSYACDQTEQMEETNQERNQVGRFLLNTIRTAKESPIHAYSQAGRSLFNLTKNYRGFYKLPHGQVTAQLNALIIDLQEEEYAPKINIIGLAPIVVELQTVNKQYGTLANERTAVRIAQRRETAQQVRIELRKQYKQLATIAQAYSIAIPSPEASKFVKSMNRLIKETNTAYKQRVAQ